MCCNLFYVDLQFVSIYFLVIVICQIYQIKLCKFSGSLRRLQNLAFLMAMIDDILLVLSIGAGIVHLAVITAEEEQVIVASRVRDAEER